MALIESRHAIPLGQSVLPEVRELVSAERERESKMLSINDLRSRRTVVLFFAFLSAVSAVTTALMPVILHV